ncbi:polygalacturonase-like [Typha latifolia]|uniref:polygalacturonase-like n=1 Tax=Typha latifolia TaxID=4733 RepID=UPI003C2C852A
MALLKLLSFSILMLFLNHHTCYSNLEDDTSLGCSNDTSSYNISSYPTNFSVPDSVDDGATAYDDRGRFALQTFDQVDISQGVFNVDKFGAKGDGSTDDTKAFEKAWAKACSSSISAILLVPKKKYLLKPITFYGSCASSITIMIKGTIEASSRSSDWTSKNRRHWMLFNGIKNLTVTGGGTINGNGKIWWQKSCKVNKSLPCKNAPTAMTFYSCNNLRVENLKVENSQQIHVNFEKCSNVRAAKLTITAPSSSPNTDGIHVTRTKNIEITNCVIKTGDDCISIVTGSKDVKATEIVCGPGHGISIGSLGAGKSRAQVSGVTIDTAQFSGTQNGVRIKTWQGGSGYAKNIVFKNLVMNDVQNPIIIEQNYCDRGTGNECIATSNSAVEVSNILYQNIKGTSASQVAVKFSCSESIPCHGIVLQNINLVAKVGGSPTKSTCENAKWSKKGTVVPAPCKY